MIRSLPPGLHGWRTTDQFGPIGANGLQLCRGGIFWYYHGTAKPFLGGGPGQGLAMISGTVGDLCPRRMREFEGKANGKWKLTTPERLGSRSKAQRILSGKSKMATNWEADEGH